MSKLFTDFYYFQQEVLAIVDSRTDLHDISRHFREALNLCFCDNNYYADSSYKNLTDQRFKKLIVDHRNHIIFEGITLPIKKLGDSIYKFSIHQDSKGPNMKYAIVTIDIQENKILAEYSSDLSILGQS